MNELKQIIANTIRKGFLHLFSANLLINIIEFGAQLFVAYLLMEEDIGRIKSFQAFAAIGLILSNFGFNTSTLKLVSEKRSLEEKKALLETSLFFTIVMSSVVWLGIFVASQFKWLSNDLVTNNLFVFYALSTPALAINTLIIAYFQALKKFKEISTILIGLRIVQVVCIILFTYFFDLKGFITGIIIGFLLSAIVLLYQSNLKRIQFQKIYFQKHWYLAKYSLLGNLISMLNLYLDVLLINHLTNNEKEFGYYGMALTFMTGLRVLTATIQQYLTPFYSENSKERKQHFSFFKKTQKYFLLFALIIFILSILIAPPAINFIFNFKYDDSIFYFQLLCIAWLIRCFYSLIGIYFLSLGKININFKNSLISFILSVAPIYLLISHYSIAGAAYSQISTAIISALVVIFSFFNFKNKPINETIA